MTRFKEGSTGQLLYYIAMYLGFYPIFMVATKWFLAKPLIGPEVTGMAFLAYSTMGGLLTCLAVVALMRWPRAFVSSRSVTFVSFTFPFEYLFLIPSGICTGIVIPTTTIMYTLPITVMTAVVIMRGVVIVIGRAVDALQIQRGILQKRVLWEENVATVIALIAASVSIIGSKPGNVPLYQSGLAMGNLALYSTAYAIRIYIMNYYKNAGYKPDTKAFFGIEQAFASHTFILVTGFMIISWLQGWINWGEWGNLRIGEFAQGVFVRNWWAVLAGVPFGLSAFYSVFLFMFKGRTATFATLTNRLTSLVAGTLATLIFALKFDMTKYPELSEWGSLALILVAVYFLSRAEKRRTAELARAETPASVLVFAADLRRKSRVQT